MRGLITLCAFVAAFVFGSVLAGEGTMTAPKADKPAPAKVVDAAEVAAPVVEDVKEPLVEVKSTVLSEYVFRGQVRNEDPVAASSVLLKKDMFKLEITGLTDLSDDNGHGMEFTEFRVDLGLDKQVYSNPGNKLLSAASLFGGLVYYGFPETARDATTEVYAGIDVTTVAGIHSKTTLFYDIDEVEGGYIESDLYKKIELPFQFNLGKQAFKVAARPEVGLGWGSHDYNQFYWGVDGSAFNDFHAELAVMAESQNWEFGPSIRYSDIIDGEVQDAQDDSSRWIFGFSLGYKF